MSAKSSVMAGRPWMDQNSRPVCRRLYTKFINLSTCVLVRINRSLHCRLSFYSALVRSGDIRDQGMKSQKFSRFWAPNF